MTRVVLHYGFPDGGVVEHCFVVNQPADDVKEQVEDTVSGAGFILTEVVEPGDARTVYIAPSPSLLFVEVFDDA